MHRFAATLAVATTALAATASGVDARGGPARVDVRADSVAFYPYANATLVSAHGGVRVRAGTRAIEARDLRYDLERNVLTAAGAVRVDDRGTIHTGDAYRLDLATGAAILLRLDPLPATFALADDAPASEREMPAPAGTFEQLDLDGQRPYIRSRHAIVAPGASIRLQPAEFPTGAGPSLRLPTFLYTLVTNQNIAQNAGGYASFDQPFNLFGSPNSLTAAHLRYDSTYGVTAGLDTRLVDRDRAYAVASVVPLRERRVDLLGFQQLRPGLQQTFAASHTFGTYAIDAVSYRLQETARSLIATLGANQFGTTNAATLDVSSLSHDVGHAFSYQVHATYGYDHALFGYPFASDFRTTAGGYVASPGITLAGATLAARYAYDATTYSFPHEVTNATLTLSGGRTLARGIGAYASASFAQVDNRYRDSGVAARALGLPDPAFPYIAPDGTAYPGYFAYAGASTFRTYLLQTTFAGRAGDDRIALAFTHDVDFPQFHGFGRPPYTASIDVVRRLGPTLRVEIGRSYDFGWGGRYLSPQYTFAISP